MIAKVRASTVIANCASIQTRGPAPNGMYAKRAGSGAPGRKRAGLKASGVAHSRRCRCKTQGEIMTSDPAGTGIPSARSSASA